MAEFKELTFEEIREQLKGTDYDRDDWVRECYTWVNSNEKTVKQWIAHRTKLEEEWIELQKKPGINDPGTAALLGIDQNGDVYTSYE